MKTMKFKTKAANRKKNFKKIKFHNCKKIIKNKKKTKNQKVINKTLI